MAGRLLRLSHEFSDLDERLIDLAEAVELVYSPIADVKIFPENVDVTLVEGAVANVDHLELAEQIRERSKIVVSFGDCAVTGNVTSLRNKLPVDDLLTKVYHEGPGAIPRGGEVDKIVPALHSAGVAAASGHRSGRIHPRLSPRPGTHLGRSQRTAGRRAGGFGRQDEEIWVVSEVVQVVSAVRWFVSSLT